MGGQLQTGHPGLGLARSVMVFAAIGFGFAALAAYLTNGFGFLERPKCPSAILLNQLNRL